MIAFADVELDAEGVHGYLAAGYSVFGHTPVRGVRFMPPSLASGATMAASCASRSCPSTSTRARASAHTEDEIIDLLRERVQAAESAAEGEIVIPTSGGYDSRLLNLMIAEPARVRSFTFGATPRQWDSAEVARARALSEMLGTRWERIHLGPFHSYLDEWDEAFGPAVHAHGMYQMEFYRRCAPGSSAASCVLSGLCGDWFEGMARLAVPTPREVPRDIQQLIFTYACTPTRRRGRVPIAAR